MKKRVMLSSVLSMGLLVTGLGQGEAFAAKNVLSVEKYNESKNSLEFKSGQLTEPSSKRANEVVFSYLNKNKDQYKYGKNAAEESFVVIKEKKDRLGTALRLQQTFKGVPVWGAMQTATVADDGVLTVFSGEVVTDLETKLKGKSAKGIKAGDAIQAAQQDLGLRPVYEKQPDAKLVVYSNGDKTEYAYQVNLNFLDPEPGNYYYFISAENGQILNKFNKIHQAAAKPVTGTNSVGSGTGVLGNSGVFLNTTYSGGTYYLQDNTRGGGIYTYDSKNAQRTPGSLWGDLDNQFNAKYDGAAVDAHSYAGVTYDFYKNTYNRNSYDNKGGALKSSVHYGRNYNNAFWNGIQMVYGDGDGTTFIPLSGGLDVVAHELTHAVTDTESDLIYQNESGALNEAVSDIFGTVVEFGTQSSKADYDIGEDIYTPSKGGDALRSMSDPAKYGDPDHYSKRYTGTSDNGGVHTNSGIINKAAYLIAAGGTHYGVSVQGVGVEKLGRIFYRANTTYFTASETFSKARADLVQAAADLYGSASGEVNTVNKAFDAVGVK
ncbi:M4 family metallopeptidase [Peribacillus deserti]|uniref:Neutral metalloproteinase n=1 Tax=Peribacillus deserti TaxID=673318 RepID=A0A2N5MAK3_9BACI|nr:M4 family metallopeptidase [Peribacillus deserti]PLT31391.1 bacillolysin [Peribacillus deserti]